MTQTQTQPQSQAQADTTPVLEIRNLTQRFGGLTAVNDFNVRLMPGELIGLIGPNGAGKTTVFNLVSGFYQPTEGEILACGVPTAGLRPHKVTALGVARTFQNIRLWNDMNVQVIYHSPLTANRLFPSFLVITFITPAPALVP